MDVYSPALVRINTWNLPGLLALYLAVDGQDNVYVTDGSGNTVRVFNGSAGVFVAQWTTPYPSGVACLNGLVYVAGMFNGVVSIFTPNGTPAGSFPTGCTWAEQLSVDPAGDLLLADHGLHQLKCFKPDGTLLWVLGPNVPGYAAGTCDFFSVVAGANGTILAGDYTNRRVLVLGEQATPASSASWGSVKARYR
jgi:DNA-binding beta-propeller fold protein YncE